MPFIPCRSMGGMKFWGCDRETKDTQGRGGSWMPCVFFVCFWICAHAVDDVLTIPPPQFRWLDDNRITAIHANSFLGLTRLVIMSVHSAITFRISVSIESREPGGTDFCLFLKFNGMIENQLLSQMHHSHSARFRTPDPQTTVDQPNDGDQHRSLLWSQFVAQSVGSLPQIALCYLLDTCVVRRSCCQYSSMLTIAVCICVS